MKEGAPAIFFDKDGTLVHDVPYNVDPTRTVFREDAFSALRALRQAGWKLFIVSNQSGIAQGLFLKEQFERLVAFIKAELARHQVELDGFYYCPHHPFAAVGAYRRVCGCRKPGDELLQRAAWDHQVDLKRSWLVGDILDDMEAGRRAGCRTILLNAGHETEWRLSAGRIPHYGVASLTEAAHVILSTA